ncbi:helix-turn-helix domain-containing protein [Leifsonia sp. NPDC058248]|uniref:helix-turn-helix domain-containing protein n=1 Tax=Leifsonia sp. NPDC058248 TaxID=3346402 RepID=UPI0036DA9087
MHDAPTPEPSNAAQRVRALREERGISRTRLNERSGIDAMYLAQVETGGGNPTLHKLIQVAAALDTTVSALVDGLGRDDLPANTTRPVTEAKIIAELRTRAQQPKHCTINRCM